MGGALWVIENPADQAEVGSVAFWHEDHFPLWLQGCIAHALSGGSVRRTVAMCAFGAPWRKYTTFAFHPALEPYYDHFALAGCDHGPHGHAERAYGRDGLGASRAEASGMYPGPLCVDLAVGASAGVDELRRLGLGRVLATGLDGGGDGLGGGAPVACSTAAGTAEEVATGWDGGGDVLGGGAPVACSMAVGTAEAMGGREGGRVLDGASLHPRVSDAVEAARAAPPRFAPTRNKLQWLARAVAVCDEAGWRRVREALDEAERRDRDGEVEVRWARALCYCVDAKSAYSFCSIQLADLWTQCFVWWSAGGVTGFAVDRRMGFGGAFAPNRFERVSTLVTAYIALLQRDFDAAHPPAHAGDWARRRSEAMGLEAGEARAAGECEAAWRMDLRRRPLRHCSRRLGDRAAGGGRDRDRSGCSGGSRCDLRAGGYAGPRARPTCGVGHAPHGALRRARQGHGRRWGSPTALGFAVHPRERRLRCPAHKRATMLAAIADLEAEAMAEGGAPSAGRREAERLTGKLCNLAQVFPELGASLQAGYALVHSAWAERARPRSLVMRAGSDTHKEWCSLLRLARELLVDNEGVALASALAFPARDEAGTLLVVTDASGVDGVGGYAFSSAAPSEVWLVSEMWPAREREARLQAELSPALRMSGSPRLAMPTAELFGSWAVVEAVVAASGRVPAAVLAVGDCQPACHALNRALGGAAQLRRVLRAARARCHSWLGVHVPRELNRDADELTHSHGVAELAAEATAAGWTVHAIAHLPTHSWEVLGEASRLPLRPEERGRYSAWVVTGPGGGGGRVRAGGGGKTLVGCGGGAGLA